MKVLSLNGGGCCGYMSAVVLALIEKETGKSCSELFDLVAGVSTGSIIATSIGKGISAEELAKYYKELASTIFKKKSWIPWNSWYSADKLQDVVASILDYNFNESKTKVMIYAAQISGPDVLQPKFWKSWKELENIKTSEIVVASCSAPIYFAPKKIGDKVYIDGGFVANNPSMCAIAEALELNAELKNIKSFNINCGEQKGFNKAEKLNSILKWIPNASSLPTLAIRTGERSVTYQASEILDDRHLEIGPNIDLPLDILDFALMDQEANKMWLENKDNILKLLA